MQLTNGCPLLRRNFQGTRKRSDLAGLDRRAAQLKEQLEAKHLAMKHKARSGWAVGIIAAAVTATASGIVAVVVLVATYIFTRVDDPGAWLVAGPGAARSKS